VGRKKAKTHHLRMAKGTIYYCKNFLPKNKTLYATKFHNNEVHQLDLGEIKEKKKKVQFIVVFYLLKEGCPLMDYESLKDFFAFSN
jgi:hypothetical protein